MRSAVLVAVLAGLSATGLAQTVSRQVHHGPRPGKDTDAAAKVMGFDQARTVHHFYLHDDGGTIDVSVKDAKDEANLHAIRMHLSRVANRFSEGDFSMPRAVHGPAHAAPAHSGSTMFVSRAAVPQNPDAHPAEHTASGPMSTTFIPGAATLSRLKNDIRYTFTRTDTGARVEIVTSNAQAAQAVHEFLRFQITEHRTGDLNAIVRRQY